MDRLSKYTGADSILKGGDIILIQIVFHPLLSKGKSVKIT
jgi:hypothetical protein